MEMIPGCGDGKGKVIDSMANAFTIEKTDDGKIFGRYFNFVYVENKQIDDDFVVVGGPMGFTRHSTFYFTEGSNGGTNVRRVLSNFCGPAMLGNDMLPNKVVPMENEICKGFLEKIKAGSFTLPEDAPRIPKMTQDLIVESTFDVMTDWETTWKYNINRTQMLEMFNGAEDGKGIVKDSAVDSWTFEKTDEKGQKSHNYFKNEVLAEHKRIKQMDKDIHFHDESGNLKFTIHSTYYFFPIPNADGTRIRRTLTNFVGPAPIAGFLPKGVDHENEIVQKYCKMIKEGKFKLPMPAMKLGYDV